MAECCKLGFLHQSDWICILDLPLPGCVTLGGLPTLSVLDSHFFVLLLWLGNGNLPPLMEWDMYAGHEGVGT